MKKSDLLRNQDNPTVLGYRLNRQTLTPLRQYVTAPPGDYGADPLGDGTFRMVPSGDVVDVAERARRLAPSGVPVIATPRGFFNAAVRN